MPAIALLVAGLALLGAALLLASSEAQAAIAPASEISPGGEGGDYSGLELTPLALDEFGAVDPLFEHLGVALKPNWTPPAAAAPYLEQIRAAEIAQGLPEGLLARVLYQESRYRPEIIDGSQASSAGALGIAQFMPATARELGVDPLDPSQAIPGAAGYLRRLFNNLGSWTEAIGAYNWGIGNVQRKGLALAPLETRKYIEQISADVDLG